MFQLPHAVGVGGSRESRPMLEFEILESGIWIIQALERKKRYAGELKERAAKSCCLKNGESWEL